MQNTVLFAFNGDAMCFVHVLLNALDLHRKGHIVRVVIEGAATGLLPGLADPKSPLFALFEKAKEEGLIEGVCRACSAKMGTLENAGSQGLALLDDMSGHPGMGRFLAQGFTVITF